MLCLSGFELYSRWVPLFQSTTWINHLHDIFHQFFNCSVNTFRGFMLMSDERVQEKESKNKRRYY